MRAINATVSVVIPVYNGQRYLGEAIDSVYAQTFLPTEVIVVNDGSTDSSAAILRRLVRSHATLRVVEQANGGPASARNHGVRLANGDLIAFLDQDDLWYPDKLALQVTHLLENPELGGSFVRCDGEVDEWDPEMRAAVDLLLRRCVPRTASTVILRRRVFERIAAFDETLENYADDWLMWLRFTAAGLQMGYLPETLAVHRDHEGNLSRDGSRHFGCALEVLDRFFADDLPSSIGRRANYHKARWHLLTAIAATERGDSRAARRHILAGMRTRPLSVRPGWLRML